MLGLVLSMAWGAEVDRGPSGTIVTVRPEGEEVACILDAERQPLSLCSDFEAPYWLVHQEAWRNAVAFAEGREIESFLPDKLLEINAQLKADLQSEQQAHANTRSAKDVLEGACETETKMLRRSRTTWTVVAASAALVVGTAGGTYLGIKLF